MSKPDECCGYDDIYASSNQKQVSCQTIGNLAVKLGIAQERVANILSTVYHYPSKLPVENFIEDKDYNLIVTKYQEIESAKNDGVYCQANVLFLGISEVDYPELLDINSRDDLQDTYECNLMIAATIKDVNSGGFIMQPVGNSNEILFCPLSRTPIWVDSKLKSDLIGAKWYVYILSIPNEGQNNYVVSAKRMSSFYNKMVKVDAFYRALVCGFNGDGYNLLVEKNIPVFMPKNFVSWHKNISPSDELNLGQWIIVKILKDNKDENNIIASKRDAEVNPWLEVRSKIPIGSVFETYITKKEKEYIRVFLDVYKGHLPASEISWTETYIPDCREYDFPDPLRVVVIGYHDKSRTVQVSLRKLNPDPWENIDKYVPKNTPISAQIESIGQNGVILKVGDLGFKGYLSFRDMDWCRYINKETFLYSVGDRIDVAVTYCNKERRQLTCSVKALKKNPWDDLRNVDKIEGTVLKVYEKKADVRLKNGIECMCHEALDKEKGSILTFDILTLNSAAQNIVISYRKKEIVNANILAVGDMFNPYRKMTDDDKKFIPVSEDDGEPIYRNFKIKEVSSTGRVIAKYAEEDNEFDQGILLPGAITIENLPVNVIFARYIVKKYIIPGDIMIFKVAYRYTGINYVVLTLDASELLDLHNIATDDLDMLASGKAVDATICAEISTERNLFVHWKGYFGYIPYSALPQSDDNLPETVLVRAATMPRHPGQMLRFSIVDGNTEAEEKEELDANQDLAKQLETDLLDCYEFVKGLDGFNMKSPDHYPYVLQLRFKPERCTELSGLLAADPTYFSSRTFFLDCYQNKDKNGYILSLFDNEMKISALCSEKECGDEIIITKFQSDKENDSIRGGVYHRPLRISGENLQIVPINSSAMPPAHQDVDIILNLLKYYREVDSALCKLSRGEKESRGAHYLTLRNLLEMDLEREKTLSKKEIQICPSQITEKAGSYDGIGIEFDADKDAFVSLMSEDDGQDGIQVLVKSCDGEDFKSSRPNGILKYKGQNKWIIEFYRDCEIDIDNIDEHGISVKRYSNIRHIAKQINAIDNYVYERHGLDIFGKISRNKLKPVKFPAVENIDASPLINLSDSSDTQANALKMALGGSEITLIQGPPGTGKSTVIVDIIRNLVKKHKKVLVCTQSVAPVKELYFKLSGKRDGNAEKNLSMSTELICAVPIYGMMNHLR